MQNEAREAFAGFLTSLCAEYQKHNQIDPAYYERYNVKRGLRNADGTGVMAGVTQIGNVMGYYLQDGERIPAPGKLVYRGIDVEELVDGFVGEDRFGFEETAYLLLFGELPTREQLATFPEGRRRLAWYDARVGDKTDEAFEAECAAYQAEVDSWNARIAARRAVEPDVSWTVLNEECGLYPWPPPAGRTGFQRPGNLYESMLRRVCPYALRGFWYYQGEQDEEWPRDYETELTCLVRRWRTDWQDADARLPFLLVQLPMYATGAGENSWPILRDAQAAVARREPNAGLVVLADLGEADNIHPVDKAPVGRRLALLTLETAYDRPVAGHAPQLAGATRQGEKAILRFAHAAGGLKLAGEPSGLELAGTDGNFVPAQAYAAVDTVTLHSPKVPHPSFVRYAWYNFGPARLYGGTGLPAAPFGATPLISV